MIRLDQLSVSYVPGRQALQDVSLTFPRQCFTVLLGPSGAGKSTLLRTMNGLVRPSSGDVTVEGVGSIYASRAVLRDHRRRTGMVFQQHHLVGRLSALANVLGGRLGHLGRSYALLPLPRRDRILALEALERVGLLERALDRADRLSGGEQQRVGIARALVQQPTILLVDEPVASLDPATAETILSLIKTLAREDDITTIVSLHQVELATRFADHLVGINGGRIVFEGPPRYLTADALTSIYAAPTAPVRQRGKAERQGAAGAVQPASPV